MMLLRCLAFVLALLCAPAIGATYYISDCQTGAHASCVAGDNSRSAATAQTSTTPWQTMAAVTTHLGGVDALPAGTVLRFAQGGAWTSFNVEIENLNATPTSRITFEAFTPAWGGTARPILYCNSTACFQFNNFGSTTYDGGYVIRGLKMDGGGLDNNCIALSTATHHGLVEDNEMTLCRIAVQINQDATLKHRYWTFRNNIISRNHSQGILGAADHSVFEGNEFRNNATAETAGFGHNFYIGASNGVVNMTVRYNYFFGSAGGADGTCGNGHLTGHGQIDGLVIEGNVIESTSVGAGCGGIGINPAYNSTQPGEYCRNCIVRGNWLINAAGVAVSLSGAPGVVVENNFVVQTIASTVQSGFVHPGRTSSPGGIYDNAYDDPDSAAIFRNNGCYFASPSADAYCINFNGNPTGTGLSMVGNLAYFAAAGTGTQRCWGTIALSNFTAWNYNLCFGADEWSDDYTTHTLAHAAGYDTWSTAGGLADNDPLFAAAPSSANGWACALQSGSPAVNVAGSGLARRAIKSAGIVGSRDIGPCER
jgi:hypothetical protein